VCVRVCKEGDEEEDCLRGTYQAAVVLVAGIVVRRRVDGRFVVGCTFKLTTVMC